MWSFLGDVVVIDEDSNDDITLDADDVTMYFHGDDTEDVDLDYLANQILGVHTIDIGKIKRKQGKFACNPKMLLKIDNNFNFS